MNPQKTSLKILALAALFSSGLGLVVLQTGCAATATKESTGEYVDDSTITAKVKAAFIHDANITGTHESISGEGALVFFRLMKIARHHIGAPNADFTRLPLGKTVPFVVLDGDVNARQWQANAA